MEFPVWSFPGICEDTSRLVPEGLECPVEQDGNVKLFHDADNYTSYRLVKQFVFFVLIVSFPLLLIVAGCDIIQSLIATQKGELKLQCV